MCHWPGSGWHMAEGYTASAQLAYGNILRSTQGKRVRTWERLPKVVVGCQAIDRLGICVLDIYSGD